MRRFLSSLGAIRRSSRESRRAPKRNRPMILEDLEGRRLPSRAIPPIATLPTASAYTMIAGADGDLWVAVNPTATTSAIDRIGLDGSVSSFPVPGGPNSYLQIDALTTGPDGNVWFDADFFDFRPDAAAGVSQTLIGEVTSTGQVTEFPPIPLPAGQTALASLQAMVSGPGGDLWFGDSVIGPKHQSQDFIGRVTTAGAVTLFPISSVGSRAFGPDSLAVGTDGNLWFTESVGKKTVLGRMSPSGVVTPIPIGNQKAGDVANGPNGSLIMTGQNARGRNEVFSVSTAGTLTRYKVPAAISDAFGTYLGPADGSLWFANEASGAIELGRITASGKATSENLSRFIHRRFPFDAIVLGQDGNLYALANGNINAKVYRLSPSELPQARSGRTAIARIAPARAGPVVQAIGKSSPFNRLSRPSPGCYRARSRGPWPAPNRTLDCRETSDTSR